MISQSSTLSISITATTNVSCNGGANGTINIEPNQVRVNLDLSFVLSPMKDTIEKKIKDELAKLFTA